MCVLFVFSSCLHQLNAREPSCAGWYTHTVQKEYLAIVSGLSSGKDTCVCKGAKETVRCLWAVWGTVVLECSQLKLSHSL